MRDRLPISERTVVCAADEVLVSMRERRLNQMTNVMGEVISGMTKLDYLEYGLLLNEIKSDMEEELAAIASGDLC